MGKPAETQLYAPIKAWLEALGYEVKSEVGPADVVACREGCEPVIVELKTGFSLTLLQQAVKRQALSEHIYVAVPRWKGRAGWRAFKGNMGLCRRLGLGVLSVSLETGAVEVHCDPAPYQPRKSRPRKAALLREFALREGDPNAGGMRGKIMTAYKQDALRCAAYLAEQGPSKGSDVAKSTGVSRATRIMADNHHGWFFRAARGVYAVTDTGEEAIKGATAAG
ncbi:hypothetical protein FDP25_11580 [Roseovarius sp. A21]|uniref:Uncharacterized protein n=1 Tax=Roseovarius bejariae TaxID=2576383 RepID=A0A844CZP7_9RHOB|nr:DUF2161 family putative PD-(D/E)XK-type phosphodiesterase [Roseovarius bejariae]MRU16070.1 hypothetical protein [Roseovarius bejariae]